MRDYDKLLQAGNKAQMEKLKIHDNKDGFDDIDIYYLYYRIKAEVEELKGELFANYGKQKLSCMIDHRATRHEFADIANFAHMGILACDKEINK